PVILDPFSHNINSTSPLSFNMYSNATPNNLSNPDSALLYEMYLADSDFNANNAFNDHSPNLTSINTPPTSNVFTVPSYQEFSLRQFDFGNELSNLNIFTQEPTFLNNVNDLNLQILNDSSHNDDNIISSFEINQITENTPFMQSNNYDMMQPLQFHTDNFNMNSNIINNNVDYDIYGLCYNDTMPYPHA
ncbi:15705_t:CDS:1, partial [Dentiscutata heterogama]